MSMTGLKKHKLAMVDLDGTLVFTQRANHLAYQTALAEQGFSLSYEQYVHHCDGRAYRDFLPEIMGQGHPAIESVHDRKIELYAECLKSAQVNERLVDILRALKSEYTLALVTTASRKNVDAILRYFALASLFDIVVTQEDVTAAKPDPVCYNAVIEACGVSRENCLIFEDSASGIAAGLASGCQTLCIKRGDDL